VKKRIPEYLVDTHICTAWKSLPEKRLAGMEPVLRPALTSQGTALRVAAT
jgi:hypothetical protein